MQAQAPEAFAIDAESAATRRLYGIDDTATESFGKQCLLARRLVERGVRFVQVYDTATAQQLLGPSQRDRSRACRRAAPASTGPSPGS